MDRGVHPVNSRRSDREATTDSGQPSGILPVLSAPIADAWLSLVLDLLIMSVFPFWHVIHVTRHFIKARDHPRPRYGAGYWVKLGGPMASAEALAQIGCRLPQVSVGRRIASLALPLASFILLLTWVAAFLTKHFLYLNPIAEDSSQGRAAALACEILRITFWPWVCLTVLQVSERFGWILIGWNPELPLNSIRDLIFFQQLRLLLGITVTSISIFYMLNSASKLLSGNYLLNLNTQSANPLYHFGTWVGIMVFSGVFFAWHYAQRIERNAVALRNMS
jgi:hypothetical protein